MKILLTLIISAFLFNIISAQEIDYSIKKNDSNSFSRKKIRIGYGPVLAGKGDLVGHKFLLGIQYLLNKHNSVDFRLSGTLIEVEKYFEGNPNWNFYQVSDGIEFVFEYNFILQHKKIRFYPSIGPSLRYSYERHADSYGIRLNRDTQSYDWFCDINENKGLRLGYEIGINADYPIFKYLRIGPRFSFSQFPKGGYTFAFIGFTLIKQYF